MKKERLWVYLSEFSRNENAAILPTLAWIAKKKGLLFDSYLDVKRNGSHMGGGDYAKNELGNLTGSLVSGGHHIEEFLHYQKEFDLSVISRGSLLDPYAEKTKKCSSILDVYKHALKGISRPKNIVMVGSQVQMYCYPEIFYRKALGVTDDISLSVLEKLGAKKRVILCFYVSQVMTQKLIKAGYQIKIIDKLRKGDNFATVTSRIAKRWTHKSTGHIVADPVVVTSYIPFACRENRTSIYGRPQQDAVRSVMSDMQSKSTVVYGRQYDDSDFFFFSSKNKTLQIIDPAPPIFRIESKMKIKMDEIPEPSDEELRDMAKQGKILASLVFWSGAPRELDNLYRIVDLVALTELKCGLVTTSDTFRYFNSALGLLGVDKELGGVWPNIEPLLGTGGNGICIEYLMQPRILEDEIRKALAYIKKKTNFRFKGYWATMDAVMQKKGDYKEYYHKLKTNVKKFVPRTARRAVKKTGLSLPSTRPYGNYQATGVKKSLINAIKRNNFKYMLTKANFGNPFPYLEKDFTMVNYTTGRWDGWTPFYTINNLGDIKKSLKTMKGPGFIIGTVDSCLWTFSGNNWKKAGELRRISDFVSNKLVNVTPNTVARYARIISEK